MNEALRLHDGSGLLCWRNRVAASACRNCVCSNGHFPERVHLRPAPGQPFKTEFFNGACAAFLDGGAACCTIPKSSQPCWHVSLLMSTGLGPSTVYTGYLSLISNYFFYLFFLVTILSPRYRVGTLSRGWISYGWLADPLSPGESRYSDGFFQWALQIVLPARKRPTAPLTSITRPIPIPQDNTRRLFLNHHPDLLTHKAWSQELRTGIDYVKTEILHREQRDSSIGGKSAASIC